LGWIRVSGLDLFAAGECCLALLGSRRIFGAVRERKEQQKTCGV